MTATMAKKLPTEATLTPFKMPPVYAGQTVIFWPECQRNSGGGFVVYVDSISQNGRSINVHDSYSRHLSGVRHMDDPRLVENETMRKSGGWEHTQQTVESNQRAERLEALENKFLALQEEVDRLRVLAKKA